MQSTGNPASGKTSDAPTAARIIKRYANRKLYDTKDSRYVTLLQIAEMVRSGEDVLIIDNNTKEDLTEVTLAQIIYEQQKHKATSSRSVPLQTLRELIHQRTEKVLSDLREGPIGRLIPGASKGEGGKVADSSTEPVVATPSLVDQAKETLEDWQQKIDERVRAVLPSFLPWQQLQQEIKRLNARIEELEEKLKASLSSNEAAKGKLEPAFSPHAPGALASPGDSAKPRE